MARLQLHSSARHRHLSELTIPIPVLAVVAAFFRLPSVTGFLTNGRSRNSAGTVSVLYPVLNTNGMPRSASRKAKG
jgi:hypothetical protein